MKRKNKMIISLITVICLLASISTSSLAAEDSQRALLVQKGLSEEVVKSLSQELVEDICEMVHQDEIDVLWVEKTETLVEENSGISRGTINPIIMEFVVIAGANLDAGGAIETISVATVYSWLVVPVWTWTDAITSDWDSSVFTYVSNSMSGSLYARYDDDSVEQYGTVSVPTELAQGSLGVEVSLWAGPTEEVKYEGMIHYQLAPKNRPMYEGIENVDSSTVINAVYTHDRTPMIPGLSLTISAGVVQVGFSLTHDSVGASANVYYR